MHIFINIKKKKFNLTRIDDLKQYKFCANLLDFMPYNMSSFGPFHSHNHREFKKISYIISYKRHISTYDQMDSKSISCIFLFICVGLFIYFYYFVNNNNSDDDAIKVDDDEQILRFKRAFKKQQSIFTPEDLQMMKDYKLNENDVLFDADSKSWDDDDVKIRKLIQFGFKLLNKYAEDNTFEECLKISTDIVLRVGRIVNKLLEINVVHAKKNESKGKKGKPKNKSTNEDDSKKDDVDSTERNMIRRHADSEPVESKKINRHTFSVYIPRLMVMYEYIGNDVCIKRYVCHPIITKLIHTLNSSLDKTESGSNMVQFALPRLLSNYLFDRQAYTNERNSPLFEELCTFYNIKYNLSTNGPTNGVYEDGSCLYHNNVARYSNLFILLGFYENIFASFGIAYNFHDIVKPIIDKLFHPNIPYVTFGLYGDDGQRTNSMKGKLGIAIMPFMGLGLFKSEHFMFSLRIQRSGIAAFFKPAKDSKDIFALGWIQLRKMYLKNVDYPEKLTWDLLIKEPGIILFEDQHTYATLTLTKTNPNIHTKVESSLIGRVPNEDVMFWMNKYKFPEYYGDIVITEMGVATNNGVEIYYCINEDTPDRKLLIRVKDSDNLKLHCEPKSSDGLAQLTRGGLTLRMVFDETNTVKIKPNESTKGMKFEYNSKNYTIHVLNDNIYYIVNVTHEGNLIEKFGGSSKSELIDTIAPSLDLNLDKTLTRSPATYMYV